MDEMSGTERRDQNYQNPLNLLQDDAFVTAVLILLFIAILEIVIGFFYSTYCSYPSMMRSDSSRRRVQYCAMAGGLGQYEQTMNEQTVKSHEEEAKNAHKDVEKFAAEEESHYTVPIEIVPPSPDRTRRNSVDIQSVLSSILSDNEDEKDAISITSNDDSIFAEDDTGDFLFDKIPRGSMKTLQHLRVLTQGSANSGSGDRGRKQESEKGNKYSQV